MMTFRMRLFTAAAIVLLSVVCVAAASADGDYYIPVPEKGYGLEQRPDIAADQKFFVGKGFALDWPSFLHPDSIYVAPIKGAFGSRRSLRDAFPSYYDELNAARKGAEIVNSSAFEVYEKIAGDGVDTLYFSPYGVFTSLWNYSASSLSGARNKFYKDQTRDQIFKLQGMINDNFANALTKREEDYYNRVRGMIPEDMLDRYGEHMDGIIDSLKTGHRFSSFSISNNIFTFDIGPQRDPNGYYPTELSLVNAISVDIRALRVEKEVSLYDNHKWLAGIVLYAKYREFEMIRISFETMKHSLLIISPLEGGTFKIIESSLDIGRIKKLLQGMRPIQAAFNFGGGSFFGTAGLLNVGKTFDLSSIGITDGMKLNRFMHSASFGTDRIMRAGLSGWSELQKVKPEALVDRYEKVLPLEFPFLFFVIDDPTGAILIMGRLSGNGVTLKNH